MGYTLGEFFLPTHLVTLLYVDQPSRMSFCDHIFWLSSLALSDSERRLTRMGFTINLSHLLITFISHRITEPRLPPSARRHAHTGAVRQPCITPVHIFCRNYI
jgi:hypothetical protein